MAQTYADELLKEQLDQTRVGQRREEGWHRPSDGLLKINVGNAVRMKLLLYLLKICLVRNFSKSEVIMVFEDIQKSQSYSELFNCMRHWNMAYKILGCTCGKL